jgi:deoxyribonuclease-4
MPISAPRKMNRAQTSEAVAYQNEAETRVGLGLGNAPSTWSDGSTRVGIHTSIAGDIAGSLESARKLGCNALQIFSASPRMWPRPGSHIGEADAARFRGRRLELGFGPLVIHANYLINLASSHPVLRARSIQAFHGEIVRAQALGADFLVVHPGSSLGAAPAAAIRAVAQALREAFRGAGAASGKTGNANQSGLCVLLENTAGMGSAVGTRFEDLRAILDEASDLPLGMCLDTAHAFAAGYAIHTPGGLEQTIAELDRTVGLKRVAVVHVNDSKTAFGSRVDRHEHIGRGKIGLQAFRRILTHPRLSANGSDGLAGRAFILETPIDAPGDDRRNVRTIWNLAGFSVKQSPRAENGFSMLRRPRRAAAASHRKTPVRHIKPARGGKRAIA